MSPFFVLFCFCSSTRRRSAMRWTWRGGSSLWRSPWSSTRGWSVKHWLSSRAIVRGWRTCSSAQRLRWALARVRKRADSTSSTRPSALITCMFNARPLSRWRWIPGPSVHQLYLREVRILQIWKHCHSGQLMTFAASQCFSREGGIEPCCCVPSYMATRTPGSRDQLPIMTVHPIYEKQNWKQKPSLRKVYPKRIKIKQMSLMCSLIIILAMNYITDEVI